MIARMSAHQWLRFEATVRQFYELQAQLNLLKTSNQLPPLREEDLRQTLAGLEAKIATMKAGEAPANEFPVRKIRRVA